MAQRIEDIASPIPLKDLATPQPKPKTDFFSGLLRLIVGGPSGAATTKFPLPKDYADIYWSHGRNEPNPQVLGASTTPTPESNYSPNITVPGKDGQPFRLPENVAQVLLNSLNDVGEATNSARVLIHPNMQTYTPEEIARKKHDNWNYGENPRFEPAAEYLQTNGTWDRGLMRNNSGTINDMLSRPFWKAALNAKGIYNEKDVLDPQKSADAARILLEYSNWDSNTQSMRPNPNYRHWYAAPLELRTR